MFKMKTILLCLLLITGCGENQYNIRHDTVFITSKIVKHLPERCKDSFACYIELAPGIGELYILKDYYPACFTHEMRHAHEGSWHGNKNSTEDC